MQKIKQLLIPNLRTLLILVFLVITFGIPISTPKAPCYRLSIQDVMGGGVDGPTLEQAQKFVDTFDEADDCVDSDALDHSFVSVFKLFQEVSFGKVVDSAFSPGFVVLVTLIYYLLAGLLQLAFWPKAQSQMTEQEKEILSCAGKLLLPLPILMLIPVIFESIEHNFIRLFLLAWFMMSAGVLSDAIGIYKSGHTKRALFLLVLAVIVTLGILYMFIGSFLIIFMPSW